MLETNGIITKTQHERQIILPESSVSISPVEKSPMETGHPINNKYKRELDELRATFNSYMENKPVKHDSVFVLMWNWANEIDDLKVTEEVNQLAEVFTVDYGFQVERKELNDLDKAGHQLNSFLSSFMAEHDDSNTLLIFYYAGHGSERDETVVLKGSTAQPVHIHKGKHRDVAWSSAETNIRPSKADVLVIFDCCNAGAFGGYNVRNFDHIPFQCIAACGPKERTRRPGDESFTSALIWALKGLRRSSHKPFTTKALLEKIKTYPKLPRGQKPCLRKRDENNDGIIWIAPQTLDKNEELISGSEHRDPTHEYIDLRFHFYRRVKPGDAQIVAQCLSKLIHDDSDFDAKHIMVLDKSSVHSKAVQGFITSGLERKRRRSTAPILGPTFTQESPALTQIVNGTDGNRDPKDHHDQTRMRLADREHDVPLVPQTTFYHLRMAALCCLQSIRSKLGYFAERVQPVQGHDTSLSDIN